MKSDITFKNAADVKINSLAFCEPPTSLSTRRLLLDLLKHVIASGIDSDKFAAELNG